MNSECEQDRIFHIRNISNQFVVMGDEISTKDLYKLIQGLVTKCDAIKTQNVETKEEIKQEIRNIKTEISNELNKIKEENENLREENCALKKRVTTIERKLKKYNLIFYGLEEKDTESENIHQFLDIVNNKLELDCCFTDIRDIQRIGKNIEGKRRPILVEFTNYKLKTEALKNSKKLQGTGIYLTHDYTPEDYEKQKVMRAHLKIARENNHEAKIRNNCLYIDGQKITYEELKNKTIEQEEVVEVEEREEDIQGVVPETSQQKTDTEDSGNSVNKKRKQSEHNTDDNNYPTKRSTRLKTRI